MSGGATDLTIDFNPAATSSVFGTITFDQVTIDVNSSTPLTSGGFTGPVSFTPSGTGSIDGAFYGPQAQSIGGKFEANDGADQYYGIFGGDLQ